MNPKTFKTKQGAMLSLSELLFPLISLSNKDALQRFMLFRVDVQSGCIINRFA